ncbi:MAG: UvrB/UvrC motif-containing protein, partial [Pirellulales bacterium]
FAFVRERARDERVRLEFDQWRPYVTMMHARAVATPLVELEQWEAAVNVLDAGIRGIEQFLADYNQKEKAGQVGELAFLQRWKQEILEKNPPRALEGPDAAKESTVAGPPDPIKQVRTEFAKAIQEERYEDAARLRDDLRRLEEPPPPPLPGFAG